jgi:fatty acyl-CoA reductase
MQIEGLYSMIMDGAIDEVQLLQLSGHPNTYTATKCIAEHMLHAKRGTLPLTIVRPSIISASLSHPFPGYIDSYAAIGGFVALYGSGFFHVMEGDPHAAFDIVPVDLVAQHIIDESELHDTDMIPTNLFKIVHSVAGLQDSCATRDFRVLGLQYYRAHPGILRPYWAYTGPKNMRYHCYKLLTQAIPLAVMSGVFKISGNRKMSRQLGIIKKGIKMVDRSFPFFFEHVFDFARAGRMSDEFSSTAYVQLLMEGVHRHLICRELYVDLTKG